MEIDEKIIGILKNSGVGVLPTDTLYGLVGSALSEKAVERIYCLKKRDHKKPMIILIADLHDLEMFRVRPRSDLGLTLKKFWPGKVSIILPCEKCPCYLHRGTRTLAFRLPKPEWLRALLRKTGPLVAPSANPESKKPAETIAEAKKYFACPEGVPPAAGPFGGKTVDFYIDAGKLLGKPSTLIEMKSGKITVLRQGAVQI